MYELTDDINNIKMHWGFAEIKVRKNENVFFHKHFLNMDISLNNLYKALKCSACIHHLLKSRPCLSSRPSSATASGSGGRGPWFARMVFMRYGCREACLRILISALDFIL